MESIRTKKLHPPYIIMLCVYALFVVVALMISSPAEIYDGLSKIVTSRSVLLTDYIYIGGIGATLVNSALVGSIGMFMLIVNGVKPNGSILMALWLTTGFAFFGKNLFNMLPLTFGVYLYSRYQKEPFINYSLVALLSATLSPVVSGISFSGIMDPVLCLMAGVCLGILVGIIFPVVSAFTVRVHEGYDLYNMGFAGGLIATFLVSAFESVGVNFEMEMHWSEGNNLVLSIILYIIFIGLATYGIVCGGGLKTLRDYPALLKMPGRLVSDYYTIFGGQVFFNMGLTGAAATTIMLLVGGDLNGPTLGGIFTIVGFSAFGKHLRNILPPMIGAIISTHVNMWDPTMPSNTIAILFSTGLAPISGQFGWFWGLVAGFLHVNTIIHVSVLNGGLNLYNNGFAAGFVALLLVPVITAFKRDKEGSK